MSKRLAVNKINTARAIFERFAPGSALVKFIVMLCRADRVCRVRGGMTGVTGRGRAGGDEFSSSPHQVVRHDPDPLPPGASLVDHLT